MAAGRMGESATKYPPPVHDALPRSQLLAAALNYARRGWAVFPCKPGGKSPLTEHGHLDATTNPNQIHVWWDRWPNANVAIVTGKRGGVWVLDVDPDKGGDEALAALEREHGKLPATKTIRTGGGGRHLYFHNPSGADIRNSTGKLGAGLDVRGEGGYIVAPPSRTTRRYEVLDNLPLADAPPELLGALRSSERGAFGRGRREAAITTDLDGPPIPEGHRNDTLTSIAGRLHDGTRDLDALTHDLLAVNEARCLPPLDAAEVRGIAASIYRRTPCKPSAPEVTPRVLAGIDYLEATANERPIRGMVGATGWAIYLAGLEACRRFGREHPEGIALSIDARTWAQMAGTEASTVSRWIRRSPLVRLLQRGSGRRSSTVLFVAPSDAGIGVHVQHSSTPGVRLDNSPEHSVATRPLLRTLYRSRWSERSHNPRRGVVAGTRMVRQSPKPPRRAGIARMGKSRAALLHAVADCPNASRVELAARLGRKPDALKKPLRWLLDAGLIIRPSRGQYAPAPDLVERVENAREIGREPEADRLQIARHERERDSYRSRRKIKAQPAPAPGETRERRESYPERRREHIQHAIAALFAQLPEYRSRRVGQITCKLPPYIGVDFPYGPDGLPKDHEVEAILDGVAA